MRGSSVRLCWVDAKDQFHGPGAGKAMLLTFCIRKQDTRRITFPDLFSPSLVHLTLSHKLDTHPIARTSLFHQVGIAWEPSDCSNEAVQSMAWRNTPGWHFSCPGMVRARHFPEVRTSAFPAVSRTRKRWWRTSSISSSSLRSINAPGSTPSHDQSGPACPGQPSAVPVQQSGVGAELKLAARLLLELTDDRLLGVSGPGAATEGSPASLLAGGLKQLPRR